MIGLGNIVQKLKRFSQKTKYKIRNLIRPRSLRRVSAKEGFDLWAPTYQGSFGDIYEQNHVMEMLGDISGLQLLDAGCGAGRNIPKYLAGHASVTGVDIAPGMITEARERLTKAGLEADLHVGDLTSLDFGDQSFDAIVASACLNGIKDLTPVFSGFSRLLKNEGAFIFSALHPDADVPKAAPQFSVGQTHILIDAYHHTFETITTLAKGSGFEEVQRLEIEPKGEWYKRATTGYLYVIIKFVKRTTRS